MRTPGSIGRGVSCGSIEGTVTAGSIVMDDLPAGVSRAPAYVAEARRHFQSTRRRSARCRNTSAPRRRAGDIEIGDLGFKVSERKEREAGNGARLRSGTGDETLGQDGRRNPRHVRPVTCARDEMPLQL